MTTDPEERHPTEPSPSSENAEHEVMRPTQQDFGKTQPLPPVTADEVLLVFAQFQDQILKRLDTRDKDVLEEIRRVGRDVIAHYNRIEKQSEDNHRWIGQLRRRTHTHSTRIQQLELRMALVEEGMGMKPIEPPKDEMPEDLG